MEPTRELIDAIYRDKVLAARQTSFEEKLFAGPRLFSRSCRLMRAGIRMQHPQANAQEVERILHERIEKLRRLDAWRRTGNVNGIMEP